MLTLLRISALALLATSASAEVPRVVTDIAPVHALVAQVMDGVGRPELILRSAASPHGVALKPSQARALQKAELVVWIGPELTRWLDKPVVSLADGADKLALLSADGTITLPFRDGDNEEEAGHDHNHAHEGVDPHAWLDPQNAQTWLSLIAEHLAELDPEHAEIYQNNASNGQAELQQLMRELEAMLTPVQDRPFVTFHDAYQYFEARFGLHNAGFVTLSDGADASPARLTALREQLTGMVIQCAFSEPGTNPGVLRGIDAGNNLTLSVLDPLGRDLPIGIGLYSEMLRNMAQSFVECMTSPG